MPEILCTKCGEAGSATDLFCRVCGAALNAGAESGEVEAQPAPDAEAATGVDQAPAKAQRSRRGCCLFTAAALAFFFISLGAVALIYLASQPGGLSAVSVEVVGSATPYPTRTPYRTATPYRTPTTYPTGTVYPTHAPYPTTGPIRGMRPTGLYVPPITMPMLGGCRVNVKNQNTEQDAVLILSSVDKGTTVVSMFVRAREAYSASSISTGTYHIFVTIGKNWDSANGRFSQSAGFFRFEDAMTFTTCSSSIVLGSYQYVDITLNVKEGPGSGTISVAPESFPKLGQ